MKKKPAKAQPSQTVARANKESWIPGIKDAELKKLLAERAKLDPGAAPSGKGKATRSPAGFIFMRPVCDDLDCPPGGPDPDSDPPSDDPCAGQTWVWQPDIAVQLNTGENDCPSAADLKRIEQGLGGNLSRFRLPDPEVRLSCQNGKIFIRIWGTRVQPNSCNDLARQRAQIPDLTGGGNFGVFINSSLIRRLANEAFQAAPKTLSSNGAPSSSGPFHLTGLSVGFKAPNIIETYITGYDERPWPDVHFKMTLIDHLLSVRSCNTEKKTEIIGGLLTQIIAALVLGLFAFAIPLLLPAVAFVLFKDIDAALNQPDNAEAGVGCRLLQNLPDQIPLPQTGGILPPQAVMARRVHGLDDVRPRPQRQKLVILYAQPAVDDRGLFVGALANRVDRTPAVRVIGPSSLSIFSNAPQTFGNYSVHAEDFFGRLSYQWSGGPNVILHSPNQARTKISFRRGNTQPGNSFDRTVTVRVTDNEGSTVTASRTVLVHVNEPDGLPLICQIRPWLPQCQPGGPDEPV